MLGIGGAVTQNAGSGSIELQKQADDAIKLLTDLKTLLQAKKPEKQSILDKVGALAKTYLQPALQAVITSLVKTKLGVK